VQPVMAGSGRGQRGSPRYSNEFDRGTGGRTLDGRMPEVGGRTPERGGRTLDERTPRTGGTEIEEDMY